MKTKQLPGKKAVFAWHTILYPRLCGSISRYPDCGCCAHMMECGRSIFWWLPENVAAAATLLPPSVTRTRCWAQPGSWSRGLTQIFLGMFWRLPEASLNQSTENSMSVSVLSQNIFTGFSTRFETEFRLRVDSLPVSGWRQHGLRGAGEDDRWLVSAAARKYSLYHFSLIPGDRRQRGRDKRVFVLKWELERQGQPRLARGSNVYL